MPFLLGKMQNLYSNSSYDIFVIPAKAGILERKDHNWILLLAEQEEHSRV